MSGRSKWTPNVGCDAVHSLHWSKLLGALMAPWSEDHIGAGLLVGHEIPQGNHAGMICFWRTSPYGREPCWMSSLGISPWEGCILKPFMEECLPWEGSCAGAGEQCEDLSHWGGTSGRTCDEQTAAPIPHLPLILGGKRQRKQRVKFSPWRREGWEETSIRFRFTSHYSTLILFHW